MELFYITEKTSKTGLKFQLVSDKMNKAHLEQIELSEKYGFDRIKANSSVVYCYGGISACSGFKEVPNEDIWKRVWFDGDYMPNEKSKEGKLIQLEFDKLTLVRSEELNQCIGFDGAPFQTIGFSYGSKNDKYFGFKIFDNFDCQVPKDCKVISKSEYNELFISK